MLPDTLVADMVRLVSCTAKPGKESGRGGGGECLRNLNNKASIECNEMRIMQ